ncbi:OLC1v1006596C1 [Oldenlandia corymbosa var. corymbosa]|uniref:OLC1v1006596C1 n=1 Tax=Oldenlandia corymbosa var. corymbosa TaxID=529605 RepID=A0AAV1DKS1_OLDCO|nr:OLC1v1006596C1 [Oldenlandia corymbosa var. corymbosa]
MAQLTFLPCVFLLLFITCSKPIFQVAAERSLQQRRWYPTDTPSGVNTCPVSADRCGAECDRRCSATSHKGNCLDGCNKCCNTCLCVPPGTFGNKECCACYDNWKNKEGGPKCP